MTKRLSRRKRSTWPEPEISDALLRDVVSLSRPLDDLEDLDPLLERIGDARFVLLGEATHGTSEFYTWRSKLSQRLIREKGFSFIAVEGDWPDCYRVNRFVKNYRDSSASARQALEAFERWPTWMWANEEVVELAEWLRQYNDSLSADRKIGFYGLDVYSLWDSMHAVVGYLESVDGAMAVAARRAFDCFEPYADDVHEYARATMWVPELCEDEVVDLLRQMRSAAPQYQHDGREAFFNAEQNALVAKNAEKYYRTMVRGDSPSWNVRDRHMVETLNRLMDHHGAAAKAIVWEHNTHIGDARATDMAADGMFNVGQLVREEHAADEVVLVGFSTHRGAVIAGQEWGAPMEAIEIPPGRPGSWEDVLHQAAPTDKLLLFNRLGAASPLWQERGHRAIGVVYRPQYEKYGNYVPSILPQRYDSLLYLDETRPVHPLHLPIAADHDLPETFPTGV